jgi:DNA-binding MarR family transcriptional regulator
MARSPARLVLDDFLPYRLSVASNLVSDGIARTYESLFGLTIPEWRLIAVIAESDGVTQHAIGQRTRMDKVTVSRAAIALVDRGLLTRAANPDDRRSHLLRLSGAGAELYAAVAPKALDLEAQLSAHFDPAEIAQFMAMLRRIEALALDAAGPSAAPGDEKRR